METAGEHPRAGSLDLTIDGVELAKHWLEHLSRRSAFWLIEAQQVARHVLPEPCSGW